LPIPCVETLARLAHVAYRPSTGLLRGLPIADGLRDISRRLAEHASAALIERRVQGAWQFFSSLVLETHYRSSGTYPALRLERRP